MFSRKEQIIQRTGKNGVGRYDFLKLLVTEFQTSTSRDAKKQVLANLANFAYDPVNYDYLRDLRVIDLFLHVLSDNDKLLVRFAIGGICNLSLDPFNKEYILQNQGIALVSSLLTANDEQTILSAVTTLMFLITPTSKKDITTPEIVYRIFNFSKSSNKRIKNLANVFLADYCTSEEVERIQQAGPNDSLQNIPLPENLTKNYCTKVPINENLSKPSKDLQIGKRVSIDRTITDDDVIKFAKLTNDYNPIHFDSSVRIVHGAFLNGLLSGVLGTKLPGPGTLVVEQLLRFPKPCYIGDSVQISVEILSARKIIKCRYSIVANSERIVLEGEGRFLMTNLS